VQEALEAVQRIIGHVIEGRYYLRALVREGGFALVFRAEEIVNGEVVRPVAVKLIYPDPKIPRAQQAEELVAVLKLRHPQIVHGISAGACELDDVPWLYLVMELAEESLADLMLERPVTLRTVWDVAEHTSSALAYLHKDPDRLVHRDVKPANLLRFSDGWRLADFGLAFTMERRNADTKTVPPGTEKYMPPEAYDGQITPAWDMWSFGVMLAEMLTGEHPFAGSHHILYAVTHLPPQLPEDLPPPFPEIIRGCLIKTRSQRWTARQVLDALHASHGLAETLAGAQWLVNQTLRQWGRKPRKDAEGE
jgi:serine/threonine protein kinase